MISDDWNGLVHQRPDFRFRIENFDLRHFVRSLLDRNLRTLAADDDRDSGPVFETENRTRKSDSFVRQKSRFEFDEFRFGHVIQPSSAGCKWVEWHLTTFLVWREKKFFLTKKVFLIEYFESFFLMLLLRPFRIRKGCTPTLDPEIKLLIV